LAVAKAEAAAAREVMVSVEKADEAEDARKKAVVRERSRRRKSRAEAPLESSSSKAHLVSVF